MCTKKKNCTKCRLFLDGCQERSWKWNEHNFDLKGEVRIIAKCLDSSNKEGILEEVTILPFGTVGKKEKNINKLNNKNIK